MSKQRPTLDQGPTQNGRTRHETRDAVVGASDDRARCGKLLFAILSPVSLGG